MTISLMQRIFKSSRLRTLSLAERPSRPSVSSINVRRDSSRADQMPIVHESAVGEVWKISSPPKKTWLSVYDLPSPVFPIIETHLTLRSDSHFKRRRKSSVLLAWNDAEDQLCISRWTERRTVRCSLASSSRNPLFVSALDDVCWPGREWDFPEGIASCWSVSFSSSIDSSNICWLQTSCSGAWLEWLSWRGRVDFMGWSRRIIGECSFSSLSSTRTSSNEWGDVFFGSTGDGTILIGFVSVRCSSLKRHIEGILVISKLRAYLFFFFVETTCPSRHFCGLCCRPSECWCWFS